MKKTRNTLATILHTATASRFRRNGKPMATVVLSAALCLGLMPVASCTGSSKNEAAPEPETTAAVKEKNGTLNPHVGSHRRTGHHASSAARKRYTTCGRRDLACGRGLYGRRTASKVSEW